MAHTNVKYIFTDDQDQQIRDLYDQGVSVLQISKQMKISRDIITKRIKVFLEDGSLQKRETHKNVYAQNPKQTEMAIAHMNDIKPLYEQGLSYEDIGAKVGLKEKTIYRYIQKMRAEGMISKRPYKRKEIKIEFKPKVIEIAEPTLPDGKPVKCTLKIARSCVYGGRSYEAGLCNFESITGKCRSVGEGACSTQACTRYSKISATNPKLKSMGD